MRKLTVLTALTLLATLSTGGTALAGVQEHIMFPIEGDVLEDICGENLTHTAGNLHIMISYTENQNRISGTFHANPQGAKLVDESGNTYSGTGVGMSHFSEPVDENGSVSFTTVDSFMFVGHGNTPRLGYKMVTHVTINANGTATVEFEKTQDLCE